MTFDFFAVRSDFERLLLFVWQETDCRIAEAYSALDQELRWLDFFGRLDEVYRLGEDPAGGGMAVSLVLWSPSVMPRYSIERIALDQRRMRGHTHRYAIRGAGFINLVAGGKSGDVITRSRMGHLSYRRALAEGVAEGVDWQALEKLGGKIGYHIRNRMAAGHTVQRKLPVLSAAYDLAVGGAELCEGRGVSWRYELKP